MLFKRIQKNHDMRSQLDPSNRFVMILKMEGRL